MDEKRNVANGKGLKDSISKFERLAKKNPKYYCYIGDIYFDNSVFKTATKYYQKTIDKGV